MTSDYGCCFFLVTLANTVCCRYPKKKEDVGWLIWVFDVFAEYGRQCRHWVIHLEGASGLGRACDGARFGGLRVYERDLQCMFIQRSQFHVLWRCIRRPKKKKTFEKIKLQQRTKEKVDMPDFPCHHFFVLMQKRCEGVLYTIRSFAHAWN